MGPKKASSANPVVKRVRCTIELKKEIVAKYESGLRVSDLARLYKKPQSTVTTILANKEAIKEAVVAKGASILSKQRSQVLEYVERLLLVWIDKKQSSGDSVSQPIICEKARQLHEDLIKKMPETSADVNEFKASKGWFERFKNRSGIHNVIRHRKAASYDKKAAEKYVQDFKGYIEAEKLKPQQVFSCDETDLFLKKMPKRTYMMLEEKALPGHKPMTGSQPSGQEEKKSPVVICLDLPDESCTIYKEISNVPENSQKKMRNEESMGGDVSETQKLDVSIKAKEGVWRSGRVRKRSSKLADFASTAEVDVLFRQYSDGPGSLHNDSNVSLI
ncbi:putative CENPB DNA-binding domain-containing protein 1 isoform X2 [Cherax quadricarinatus]|uniref:putative CENPB DNA-binding domain-containing protein 1 isoform X2 n=1 Tax=Cherax quadricarinatus TaxID=27406 RepID=UPI00387EAB16